jgi:predicted DNA-binding transcriptional regulator YafY
MTKSSLIKLMALLILTTSFYPKRKYFSKQGEIITTLCKAIKEKKVIKFYYDDKYSSFKDWRIVEPYLIGNHKSTGNSTLVGWFLSTTEQSQNDHPEDWGNYLIDRIKNLQILDKTFLGTRPNYNPNDKRMKIIHCSIQYRRK